MLNGLFDINNRLEYLTENSNILPNLKKIIPWEEFQGEHIYNKKHESNTDGDRLL